MSGLGRQGTQDALQIKKRVLTHLYSKPPFIYVETEALRGLERTAWYKEALKEESFFFFFKPMEKSTLGLLELKTAYKWQCKISSYTKCSKKEIYQGCGADFSFSQKKKQEIVIFKKSFSENSCAY